MTMSSNRPFFGATRAARLALLAALVLPTVGCDTGEVRHCDGEPSVVDDAKTMRSTSLATLDPTVGGVLKGKPSDTAVRSAVLLVDYSGSMYGGYGRELIPSCDRCAAGLRGDAGDPRLKRKRKRRKKAKRGKPIPELAGPAPDRRGQPYYFGVPEFGRVLARWLDAASPAGELMSLEVLLFNQKVWRLGPDGVVPFDGTQMRFDYALGEAGAETIERILSRIQEVPFAVDSQAPLTTETSKALARVISAIPDHSIVWLLTDNIVDTSGGVVSVEDARRNLEFYELLQNEPRIQMVVAYPLHEVETCSWLCGGAMFLYGMYISPFERPDGATFHRIGGTTAGATDPSPGGLLWNTELRAVATEHSGKAAEEIAGVPLRLKPIDREVLGLSFVDQGGQAMACDQQAEYGDSVRCFAKIRVSNLLRHQVIESASLAFEGGLMLPHRVREKTRLPWASAICAGEAQAAKWQVVGGRSGGKDEPLLLGPIAPMGSVEIEVVFELPAITVGSSDLSELLAVALTDRFQLTGTMAAKVTDVRTKLQIPGDSLEGVYGVAELPAIFRGRTQGELRVVHAATAIVGNDGQLLGFLLLCGIVLGTLLVGGLILRFQRLHLTVLLDGAELDRVSMPRLSRRKIRDGTRVLIEISRGWSRSFRVTGGSGFRVRKEDVGWRLTEGSGDYQDARVIEVRHGWGPSR